MHGVWRLPTRSTQDRCEGCPTHPAWRSLRHPVGPHGIIAPEGGHLSSRASGNLCHHACFLSEFVFLPPFAPTAFTAFFATMAALTAAPDGNIPSLSRSSSPCPAKRDHVTFRTFRRQPSNIEPASLFSWLPFSAPVFPCLSCLAELKPCSEHGSGLRHTLEDSPQCSTESRSSPSDCPFAFRCFPPRLAATQLRSATCWNLHMERTCTSPTMCAHRRTSRSIPAPVLPPPF